MALATNVTVNGNVVRRVGKHQGCLGAAEQGAIATAVEGIATEQAVMPIRRRLPGWLTAGPTAGISSA